MIIMSPYSVNYVIQVNHYIYVSNLEVVSGLHRAESQGSMRQFVRATAAAWTAR